MNTENARLKKHKKEEVLQYLEKFEASGLSRDAFSKQIGVKPNTFYSWVRKFGKVELSLPKESESNFVKLDTSDLPAPSTGQSPSVRVSFPDGKVLEIFPPVDIDLIKSLIINF